jgi:hypothetical protein
MLTSFQLQHITLDELHYKKDMESYDSIMEDHPNYPKILWRSLLRYITWKKKMFQQQ